ncbi:MAG: SDR family NAD(P)-dependent oxidoreductase, partial [Planctomycetota bacterium]
MTRRWDALDDEAMGNEFRRALFDASGPMPSIETLLHAFLPHPYVDHSHADAVLVLTNQPDGERLVAEAVGDRVAVVPYVTPGLELAQAVAKVYEADPSVEGVVLAQHGLVTFGDDARTSYERHIAIVDACERMITRRAKPLSLEPDPAAPADAADLASTSAPMLRGLLAWPTGNEDRPYLRSVLEWRAGATVDQFLRSRKAHALAEAGPLTSDHLIRTKPWPMFVERPNWEAPELLRAQLKDAVESYRDRYRAYVIEHGGSMEGIVPSPTVVLLPGAGVFCWGRTKGEARIAADITEQTLAAKLKAQQIGTYQALAPEHLFAMEYRSQQRAKLATSTDRTLDGQVVVISGGAGAIGAAVAETCAEAGAHVVVTDLDEERLKLVTQRVEQRCGRYAASGIVMDVTDESSVRRGFEEICRWYGGVDVVVPNAGIAHVAPIEELVLEDFRRVMDVNVSGYLLFMREGIRILKQQGLGGHIVINASKNVFGPGKDFGAYSASKAAG